MLAALQQLVFLFMVLIIDNISTALPANCDAARYKQTIQIMPSL